MLAYDRRGFGRSDQPFTGYDYDTLSDDLAALVDATGSEEVSLRRLLWVVAKWGVTPERASAGKHVLLDDLNTGYDTNDFADVVHPDKAGYDFMAEKWYEVVAEYLPDAP